MFLFATKINHSIAIWIYTIKPGENCRIEATGVGLLSLDFFSYTIDLQETENKEF